MVAAEIMVDSLRLKGTLTSRMPRCGDRHECCRECEFALAARWGTDGVCSAVAELKCRRAISGGFHPGSGTSHDGQRGECKDKSKDCRSGCLGRRSAFHYSVLLPHFGGRDRAGSGVVRIVSRDLRQRLPAGRRTALRSKRAGRSCVRIGRQCALVVRIPRVGR
jgi:hypothetical protein